MTKCEGVEECPEDGIYSPQGESRRYCYDCLLDVAPSFEVKCGQCHQPYQGFMSIWDGEAACFTCYRKLSADRCEELRDGSG